MDHTNQHILLFDGVCNLCNRMVQLVIKRDKKGKFKFASLQSESGQALLKKWKLPQSDFTSFVYINGDKCYTRSTGVLHALKELGPPWNILYVFRIIPSALRDPMYDFLSKRRYKLFGKRDACMVPTPELKSRFLE
jgi:predicted DCC family thiol-disulfide oxidoreductase YuxK